MTKRIVSTSLILIFAIAIMFAIIISFTPNTAYADAYTITWKNDNGDVLETDENVEAGATPSYDGTTPTKEATAQYTYTFSGWSPAISEVAGDQVYTATFEEHLRSYTITWKNGDATLETDENVSYGTTPTYDGETPLKDATLEKTYTFSGWSPEVAAVTGAQEYQAQFDDEDILYTITWKDDNGDTLETLENATYVTAYPGLTPQKEEDKAYTYAFNTWGEVVDSVNHTIVRTATYTQTPKLYTVVYQDWNGDELYSITDPTAYNSIAYSGSTPEREQDAQYTYVFDDWSEAIEGTNIVYTATYTSTLRQYTITWVNGSDVLQEGPVNYGETPQYEGATPTKPDEGGQYFTFTGWDPEVTTVTGAQTYTAQFDQAPKTYKVTYGDGENDFINVVYGTNYQLPVLTEEGKWLTEWKYSSTTIANHDGASLAVYTYETDIIVTPTWIDFDIDIDLDFVVVENGVPTQTQLTTTSTGDFVYTSSNEKVFTVSDTGLVTCVGKGRAIISATQAGGGSSDTCTFVSVDKVIDNEDFILNITINEGIDNQEYLVLCDDKAKIDKLVEEVFEWLEITNDYVSRTDLKVEINKDSVIKNVLNDSSTLNLNLIYNVSKVVNSKVSYRLSGTLVEYNSTVYIYDLIPVGNNSLGNITAKGEKYGPVAVLQGEKSFIMPQDDVLVDVLLAEVPITSKSINKVEIRTKEGIASTVKVSVEEKQANEYDSNITISPKKESIAVIHVDFKDGDETLSSIGEYTLTFTVPKELLGKDGIELFYTKDGETYTRQVAIEGNYVTVTLTGAGDFVFAANVHESTTYLYWLIIIMLFLDALLGMILVILATSYTDALARRKALNGYSVVFSPIVLLASVVAAEMAVVAFLGLVMLIELIAIAWLSLKLSNKYFMYTTYHKLYRPRYDDEEY